MQVQHFLYFTRLCTLLTFWVYTPLLYQNLTFCTKLHHSNRWWGGDIRFHVEKKKFISVLCWCVYRDSPGTFWLYLVLTCMRVVICMRLFWSRYSPRILKFFTSYYVQTLAGNSTCMHAHVLLKVGLKDHSHAHPKHIWKHIYIINYLDLTLAIFSIELLLRTFLAEKNWFSSLTKKWHISGWLFVSFKISVLHVTGF